MVVYHGSDHKFDELRLCPEHTYPETFREGKGVGIYFTDLVSEAYNYGKYVYEIEIPDGLVVNCCDKKWRRAYYKQFVDFMRQRFDIRLDKAMKSCLYGERSLDDELNDLIAYDVNDFAEGFLEHVSGCLSVDDATWDTYWAAAVEFDRENYHTVYWFERTRDEHKGVILKLVDGIRLLGRMCPASGVYTDFKTGQEIDFCVELDAWFELVYPALSDPGVDGQEKDRLVQEAVRMIQLRRPWDWGKTMSFLRDVRNGKAKRDATRRFRCVR